MARPANGAARRFLSAPYVLGEDGRYRCAGRPKSCPKAEQDQECRIKRQGRRVRKTGPAFAPELMLCRTHEASFTVYPPGYEPYGRQSVAPVSAGGEPLQGSECEGEGPERLGAWRGTLFRRGPRCSRGPAVGARANRG